MSDVPIFISSANGSQPEQTAANYLLGISFLFLKLLPKSLFRFMSVPLELT